MKKEKRVLKYFFVVLMVTFVMCGLFVYEKVSAAEITRDDVESMVQTGIDAKNSGNPASYYTGYTSDNCGRFAYGYCVNKSSLGQKAKCQKYSFCTDGIVQFLKDDLGKFYIIWDAKHSNESYYNTAYYYDKLTASRFVGSGKNLVIDANFTPQRGDIMILAGSTNGAPNEYLAHVGICISSTEFVDASGDVIRIRKMSYEPFILGYFRFNVMQGSTIGSDPVDKYYVGEISQSATGGLALHSTPDYDDSSIIAVMPQGSLVIVDPDKAISGTTKIYVYYKGQWGYASKNYIYASSSKINANMFTAVYSVNMEYTGSNICPSVEVSYGDIKLQEGKDYTLAYSNNLDPGIAQITISGCGKLFTGTMTAPFQICNVPTVTPVVQECSHQWENISIEKSADVFNEGSLLQKCSKCGETRIVSIPKIEPSITLNTTGLNLECGGTFDLVVSDLAAGDDVLSVTSSNTAIVQVEGLKHIIAQQSTGSAYIKVTLLSGKTVDIPVNVTKPVNTGSVLNIVISGKNKIAVGATAQFDAAVTVSGNQDKSVDWKSQDTSIAGVTESGLVTAIKPGKTVISAKSSDGNVEASQIIYVIPKKNSSFKVYLGGTKKIDAYWEKQEGVSGYQIQYSTSSSFSSKKSKTLDADKTSYSFKVSKKKTYYVRIRSYVLIGSEKYYGAWKKVKIKVK